MGTTWNKIPYTYVSVQHKLVGNAYSSLQVLDTPNGRNIFNPGLARQWRYAQSNEPGKGLFVLANFENLGWLEST